MAKLYIVGTPIGNLGDMSSRAVKTLSEVDFIAAEDTRVTIKLLNHFDIKKPMISYHEHNIREKGEQICHRILQGESCAIVTDAGMPCISDPGEDLVKLCHEMGIKLEVVPGPSAVISALAASGLMTGRFAFEGFLSVKKNSRSEHLNKLKQDDRTLIFYEAPHKLLATLGDMLEVFGDRKISIARELTKLHEEIIFTTLTQAVEIFTERAPRGEFVLVVEGAKIEKEAEITMEQAVEIAKSLIDGGMSASQAAKEVSSNLGVKKSALYSLLIKAMDKD